MLSTQYLKIASLIDCINYSNSMKGKAVTVHSSNRYSAFVFQETVCGMSQHII